jgi:hypothetical protein
MLMNNSNPVGASIWPMALFLIVALVFGAVLATTLPQISLIGLASNIGMRISNYVGGVGISLTMGGGGVLVGIAFRRIFASKHNAVVAGAKKSRKSHDAIIAGACLCLGVIFATWYSWSFLHLA